MAELTGRRHGYAKGKGGSMHMFSVEKNFYGGHGIVGAPAPLGTGLAFANKYRGNGRVCLTFFGEGAANQGQVYESFNMASLWKLPVIYVIENNHYAMGTPVERGARAPRSSTIAARVFGIPGEQVDGMDVRRGEGGRRARRGQRRARGEGPDDPRDATYRYRGHSMSDPAKYRTREEVQEVREHRDPIELSRNRLDDSRPRERSRFEGDRRARSARSSTTPPNSRTSDPEPDPSELYTDVTAK